MFEYPLAETMEYGLCPKLLNDHLSMIIIVPFQVFQHLKHDDK
jgi:hypothetical protein